MAEPCCTGVWYYYVHLNVMVTGERQQTCAQLLIQRSSILLFQLEQKHAFLNMSQHSERCVKILLNLNAI